MTNSQMLYLTARSAIEALSVDRSVSVGETLQNLEDLMEGLREKIEVLKETEGY